MPPVSEKQRRAMWAAAEGHSKLGIPKSVGEEFVRADANQTPPAEGELTDREAAEAIRDGELPSPTRYGDYYLFDLRITGTGAAYRDSIGEYAIRDPKTWLSDEFIDRCNGLPVIDGHPDKAGLNTEEWRERAIGTVVLPYRKADEVWGVAKIYDADAATLMQTTHRSTSPGVLPPKGSTPVSLESGVQVLDEALPLNLDHVAICPVGVWDKDGPPEGIRLDALALGKGTVVPDEEKLKELEKERDDAKMRADAAEKERDDAKRRADAAEKERADAKEREDKARKDAEETEKEAVEREERQKDDARKKRHDARKHDGMHKDCSRCDSEEKEEKERRDRHDAGAPAEDIDANREQEIKDAAKRYDELAAQVKQLTDSQAPLTIEDRNAIAQTFHRADTVYQMLGERTPLVLPGEKPLAYRRRCADGLRQFTASFKEQPIHDSVAGAAFDTIESRIYDEARAEAKNPTRNDAAPGRLIEHRDTTTTPGRVITRFYGDARVFAQPFMPQVGVKITKINRPNQQGAAV